MVNNNISFLTVILVVLVVAVIASLITVSITGNVIKVRDGRRVAEVYTKQEVDKLLERNVLVCDGLGQCVLKSSLSIEGTLLVENGQILSEGNAFISGINIGDEQIWVENGLDLELGAKNSVITLQSPLISERLAGSGSAYACLDSKGLFFRSSNSCV